MPEQQTPAGGQQPPEPDGQQQQQLLPDDADAAIRKSKAFKAVTTQLNEARKTNEELAAQMEKFRKAEELRAVEDQKKAGDFESAEKTYLEKIAELEAKAKESAENGKRQQTIADLKIQLTSKGVLDLEHVDMLSERYFRLEDPPAPDEWVEKLAEKDSYAVFFQKAKPGGMAPPPAQGAATRPASSKTLAELKQDLTDPAKAKEASDLITSHFEKHGAMPD
jgi:hypothetical protein